LREIPRHDQRRKLLKEQIRQTLATTRNYQEFGRRMKQHGYEVIKSRGIAFRDQQKVYIKGSEVGFSLSKIETLLQLKPELRMRLLLKEKDSLSKEKRFENQVQKPDNHSRFRQSIGQTAKDFEHGNSLPKDISATLIKTLQSLMKPELQEQTSQTSITEEEIKRRQKQKQRQRHRPS